MKTTIILTIDHAKPVPDLTDQVAGRVYNWLKNMDHTADVTAAMVDGNPIKEAHDRLVNGNHSWAAIGILSKAMEAK